MKKLFIVAALAAASTAGHAGAVVGATEFTQIANNIELVTMVGQNVQTVANTLMTAQSTMAQLRQLGPAVIGQMTGLPIDQVQLLADAYTVFSRSHSAYTDAENVLRKAEWDAHRLGITPSELLGYKAEAAYKFGGVYMDTYQDEQEKLKRLSTVSAQIQEQSSKISEIDANVHGLQFIAGQNVQVQSLLAGISDSIAKANANASAEANRAQIEKADAAIAAKAALDARRKAEAEAPRVGRLKLPGELNSK